MGRAAPMGAAGVVAGDESQKSAWPELVGTIQVLAANKINNDRPDVSVEFYMVTTPLPTDYNPSRVILVADERTVVVRIPFVG